MSDFTQTAVFSIVKKNYIYLKSTLRSLIDDIRQLIKSLPPKESYNYKEEKANLVLKLIQ